MEVVFLVGRILVGLLFVSRGLQGISVRAGSKGESARSLGADPDVLVPLSGIVIIAGGLMIALGLCADLGALFVLGFLAGITPIMHAYWKVEDPQMQQVQVAMF